MCGDEKNSEANFDSRESWPVYLGQLSKGNSCIFMHLVIALNSRFSA